MATRVYVAPSAEPFTVEIISAAEALNAACGVDVFEVYATDGEGRVDGSVVVRVWDDGGRGFTRNTRRGVIVWLPPRPSRNLIAHELGHAAGLGHVKDPSNLMWFGGDRGKHLEPWQLKIIRGAR